ncbi:MAG TPA: PrsW family glutamic-type intramembrane protease [Chloroflexota bacterium]|nr:PrsW family glutamic-type intramembrane protease [Chloroflexota bacterium]
MRCTHCAKDVPDASFCTWCGRHQAPSGSRFAHFGPHPGEHVFNPGVITTLFPHLGRHKVHEFRWALIAGIACLFLLDLAGLITAALLCAAFLLPVLYLMYLYEAQVYRDEPGSVLGFTIGGGLLLGLVTTLVVKSFSGSLVLQTIYGHDTQALLVLGLLVPVVQELLKLFPALLLRGRAFPERVDGLVFGVAAGLGFSIAETLVRFSSVLTSLPARVPPANWIYPLFTLAVLLPLLQGSTTGAIACALWRVGRRRFTVRDAAVIGLAVAAHIGFILISQLLSDRGLSQLLILGWQAVVVAAMLLVIRYLLHETLREEASDMGFVECICPNCHHHLLAARYCPLCGKALAAAGGRARDQRAGAGSAPALEV